MGYLLESELEQLTRYEYKAGLYGWLDRVVMTPFWERVVLLLPLWLAPNLVTLCALLHALSSASILLWYAPSLKEPVPSWAFFVHAYSVFMYQTLDAIDGKQARRTGASSPLGQLFDHGCDALSCLINFFCTSIALQLDRPEWLVAVFVFHVLPFFFLNFEECHTGMMRFGVIGVTEAQLVCIAFYSFTGFVGQNFWKNTIIMGYEARYMFIVPVLLASLYGTAESWLEVWRVARDPARNSKFAAGKAVLQAGQLILHLVLTAVWVLGSGTRVLQKHPLVTLLIVGIGFCYLVTRVIIVSVTKGPCEVYPWVLWPVPLLLMLAWFPGVLPVDEEVFLKGSLLWSMSLYVHFVVSAIREISAHLKIHPFLVPAHKLKKSS